MSGRPGNPSLPFDYEAVNAEQCSALHERAMAARNLQFDKLGVLGDDSAHKAQGRGELEARDKSMQRVLSFFVRTCHILFRGLGPKASAHGVRTGEEIADVQKIWRSGEFSGFFQRMFLVFNPLRMIARPPSQGFDFSRVGALFHAFFAIFHASFQTDVIDYMHVTKITWVKRQICVNESNYL